MGLPEGVKVICGGVDNSCMALGAKGNADGRVYTSLGSSAWIALVANKPILDFKYKPYVFAHLIEGMYASATCIFSAGSSFQWVRNQLCKDLMEAEKSGGENCYEAMNRLAELSPVGANGVLFNPSLAGGSSIEPSPDISGGFVGLRLQHTREDIIRASMEGVALNLKKALDIFRLYYPDIKKMLIVGGGAKSAVWMQIFANVYQTEIEKTNIDQQAATLGAAALALKGVGVWSDYSCMDSIHFTEAEYVPNEASLQYASQIYPRFEKLCNLLADL
jgi:xylulokinase